MTAPLEAPRSVDDLYLVRDAEPDGVSRLRPIMTGDVFEGIEIPGVETLEGDERKLALIVSHPCSMRQGDRLNSRVQAVRVIKTESLKLEAWPKGHYDRMPLPELTVIADPDDIFSEDAEAELAARIEDGAHAAMLDFRGRVESLGLDLDRRIACMTEQGVAFLHQRISHYDTRYAPEIELLIEVCSAVFAEIDLWEQWNEALVDPTAVADLAKLSQELERVGKIFDSELSKRRAIVGKKNGWYTLRADLGIPKRRSAAIREIHKLLRGYQELVPQVS
jgi:hypothetical protein